MSKTHNNIHVSSTAYNKIILHSAKYPQSPILGLLLSEVNPESKEAVNIIDVLPLFHSNPSASLLETSLSHAEIICSKFSPPLTLSGIYTANELLDKRDLSPIAQKLANKINENHNGSTVILIVDNMKLSHTNSSTTDSGCLESLIYISNKWVHSTNSTVITLQVETNAVNSAKELLLDRMNNPVYDFQEHVDDCTKDWRNPKIQ